MEEHRPTKLGVLVAGGALGALSLAWLALPGETAMAMTPLAFIVAVVSFAGFSANACRVVIDPANRVLIVQRFLSRRTEVVPFDDIAEVRAHDGRGAGITLVRRSAGAVAIPYAGLRDGRALLARLRQLLG